jgi:NitT/TauT family transport system permease protein
MATRSLPRRSLPLPHLPNRVRKALFYLLYIVVILAIWDGFVRVFGIRPFLLPGPLLVAEEAYQFAGLLLSSTAVTLYEALIGFAIAAVIGIVIAVGIAYSRVIDSLVMTALVGINAAPKVAVAPILIIWLGTGVDSKIALAFLISFFPITVNAVRGFSSAPNDLINLYRIMRATPLQVFRKVRLPHALPAIFDGFKIALPIAMVGAVSGEFLAAREGIGYRIRLAIANFNSPFVWAGVILIAIEAILLFQILIVIERRVLFWLPSREKL